MRPSATLRFGVVYMKKGHETKAQMGAAMQATIRIRDVGGSFFFLSKSARKRAFGQAFSRGLRGCVCGVVVVELLVVLLIFGASYRL